MLSPTLKICLRIILLSCSVRHKVEAEPVLPPKVEGKSYSVKHGSVEVCMMHVTSHDYPCHHEYDSQVHCMLEEASRGITHASSIKLFQKKKDGRAAFL